MTKEMAYEYLKGKKVKMDVRPLSVQEKLQEIGFYWDGSEGKPGYKNTYGICLGLDGIMRGCDFEDEHLWAGYLFDPVTPKEILSIEIVK
jgi:hypothetical protein